MHSINIGISSHNDLIITQCVKSLFDIKGSLKQIELLVLIDNLLGESEAVERLSS